MGKRINKILKITGVLVMALSIMMTGVYAEEAMTSGDKMDAIIEIILDKYLDNDQITEEMLFDGAMEGMFGVLDPYSNYIAADNSENFTNSINRTYTGVGIQMTVENGYIVVTRVFYDGPAYHADIKVHDKIVAVDGQSVVGEAPSEAANLILGEAGTDVQLTIDRDGYVFDVTIVRGLISIEAVEVLDVLAYKADLPVEVAKTIGVIKIDSFTQDLDSELKVVLEGMKEEGVTHLIIDLRDNGGGYVTAGVEMLQRLVPNGPILKFINNQGEERIFTSHNINPDFDIVALVNENSASATEFVAASIAETGIGTLVGETTFGKGVAQFVYPLADGSIFKLTQEEFLSGRGATIHEVGVTPKYIVEIPELMVGGFKIYPGDTYEEVINLEEMLVYLGYEVGTVDNLYDQVSVASVKQFQEDQGLYPYGVCDLTTQKALNDALVQHYKENDLQMKKGIEVLLEKIEQE